MEQAIHDNYGYDMSEAGGLLEYITELIEINNNTDFLELSYKEVLECFKNPSEYALTALAWARSPLVSKSFFNSLGKVPSWPLILHGVVISSKQLDRTRSSMVLVDEETFESCGSTNAERLRYLNNHRSTSYLLYAYTSEDNKSIGKICDIAPCSRIYVSLSGPTINETNLRMIVGEIVDAIYDNNDCDYIYNDDLNFLHGKEDYFRLYNTYRERIIEYITIHDVQSTKDLPSDFIDIIIYGLEGYHAYYKAHYSRRSEDALIKAIDTISKIYADTKEEWHQEYLKNKSTLDPSKSCEDYERQREEAEQQYKNTSKNYIDLLDHYISSGTEEQKKHAKALKMNKKLSSVLFLLLFITGPCAFFPVIEIEERFFRALIWGGIFATNLILYLVLEKRQRQQKLSSPVMIPT